MISIRSGALTLAVAVVTLALSVPLFGDGQEVAILLVNFAVALALIIYLVEVRGESIFLFLAVALGLAAGLALAFVVSDEPFRAMGSLLTGPLSRSNRWGTWIEDSITLCILGLSYVVVFRANQISLGAEGQLHVGALGGALVGLFLNLPALLHVPTMIAAAMIGGFLWGFIPGILKSRYGASEIVSTLMLNVIAVRLYTALINGQLKDPEAGFTQTKNFNSSSLLPNLVDGTRITIALPLAGLAVILVAAYVQRARGGYRLRMVGANRVFARYGGIDERKVVWFTIALSGAIAGLAGAHLAFGIHGKLILNISLGLGFEGIVVALLARSRPLAVPFAALLYAYIRVGAQIMERESDVSFEVVRVVQAVIILIVTVDRIREALQARKARQSAMAPNIEDPVIMEVTASE